MDGSLYIGYTSNLQNRLIKHNSGVTIYTSRKRPWKIVYTEIFPTKSEAIKSEEFIAVKKA